MHCFDDKNSFLCMWNSLAFDPRARIWFYARHHNFVGLTYFVFSVNLSFRADADWSCSCTEIAGLWTHVHSFPLAAFDDCVGVAFLVLFVFFFGFACLAACAFTFTSCLLHWRLRSPCRGRLQRKKKRNFSRLLRLYSQLQCTALTFVSYIGDCDHPVARACRGKKKADYQK